MCLNFSKYACINYFEAVFRIRSESDVFSRIRSRIKTFGNGSRSGFFGADKIYVCSKIQVCYIRAKYFVLDPDSELDPATYVDDLKSQIRIRTKIVRIRNTGF
jgi:hypothetical protein